MLDIHKSQYEELRRFITESFVPVLIIGAEGVGKKTLVRRVLRDRFPTLSILDVQVLNIEASRQLKRDSIRKSPTTRVYLIDGDHATVAAYNAILKLLEEPPADILYIITSSIVPIPTIVSRCRNLWIPPLMKDELIGVLNEKGMSERTVAAIVPMANGSVAEALKVYTKYEEKRRLIPFIRALKEGDVQFVFTHTKTITKDDVYLMIELCDDVLLSTYGLINSDIASIVAISPLLLRRIKEALQGGSSPSIAWTRAWFKTREWTA